MKKRIVSIFLIITLLVGCTSQPRKDASLTITEAKPESLKVYLTGVGIGGHDNLKQYFTPCIIGPIWPIYMEYGYEGHLCYAALQKFAKETGIHLDLHFFALKSDIEYQLEEDRKNGTMPDVIFLDNFTYGDWDYKDNLYRLMASDWFYDVRPFMEADDMLDSEEYNREILRAGEWKQQQLLLPVQFNMTTIFTSKEDMDRAGVYIEQGMTYEDVLHQLGEACADAKEGVEAVDLLEVIATGEHLASILWEASGVLPVDYENQQVTMERDLFEEIAESYSSYLRMEYRESWDEYIEDAKVYGDRYDYWTWEGAGSVPPVFLHRDDPIDLRSEMDEWLRNGLFYVEGGNGFQTEVHSFVGHAAFLDTLYADAKKDMKVVGVPSAADASRYTALVRLCGGVMKESQYPYYSYELIKHMMGEVMYPYNTVPVNRKTAEEMLDTICSTEYKVYPLYGMFENMEKHDEESILIRPMSEETREELEYMMDHIGTSTLPNISAYLSIMKHMHAYAMGKEDMETAYESAKKELEEHIAATFPVGN